ncbi:MAG: hypothetical protein HKM02_04525 [Pseudomonadales bacterium]|nr:hypothetical protein [Pseudomonadales bacterium]
MMPSLPRTLLYKAVETMVNLALLHDPGSLERLQKLQGKRVFVEIHQPELILMISIETQGLRLLAEGDAPAHATVETRSLDILREFFRAHPQWVDGPVRVSGQVSLIQELYDIMRHIDIDWEEPLAKLVGDQGAHHLGRGLRQLISLTRHSARVMFQNSRDYLQEELGAIPMRWESDEAFTDIQDARSDADRLHDKLTRLEQRVARLQEPAR